MVERGASLGVVKAMFWPRRLSTMTVMGEGEGEVVEAVDEVVVDAMLEW